MYTDFDRFRDVSAEFEQEGYITGTPRVIKRGKEAAVLCYEAGPSLGAQTVALKIFKEQEVRNFRNDAAYLRGKVWKRRDLGHLHAVKQELWVDTEYRVLARLSEAGVRVPRPYVQIGHAVLMEHVTLDGDDAPQLKDVRLDPDEARRVIGEVLRAVDTMLDCGIVHGDLSAFNILYDGRPVIIDFPQAVYAATNDEAYALFRRDVERVCDYFARSGADPAAAAAVAGLVAPAEASGDLADALWSRHYRLAAPDRAAAVSFGADRV